MPLLGHRLARAAAVASAGERTPRVQGHVAPSFDSPDPPLPGPPVEARTDAAGAGKADTGPPLPHRSGPWVNGTRGTEASGAEPRLPSAPPAPTVGSAVPSVRTPSTNAGGMAHLVSSGVGAGTAAQMCGGVLIETLPATDTVAETGIVVARGLDGATKGDIASSRVPEPSARPVVRQILEQVQLRNGVVDVTLAPEELGRLTVSVAMQDGVLSVMISAERQETLDLIRRHAELLQQEARAVGYSGVDLGFSEHPPDRQRASTAEAGRITASGATAHPVSAEDGLIPPSDGLDLRL